MEDSQPNERLSRRFHANVPIIQSSIRPSQPPFRQRGHIPTRTAQASPTFPPGHRGHSASVREPPSKRRKYDNRVYTSPSWRRPTSYLSEDKVTITLNMPEECHRGIPNSRKKREQWVQDKIASLLHTKQLRVLNHTYGAQSVRFVCTRGDTIRPELKPPVEPEIGLLQMTGFRNNPRRFPELSHPNPSIPLQIPDVSHTVQSAINFGETYPFQSGSWTLCFDEDTERSLHIGQGESILRAFHTSTASTSASNYDDPPLQPIKLEPTEDMLFSRSISPDNNAISPRDNIYDETPHSEQQLQPPARISSPPESIHPSRLVFPVDHLSCSIRLPADRPFDKPRIILHRSLRSPAFVVSAHGFIDAVNLEPLGHAKVSRSCHVPDAVTDACLLGDAAIVLSHARTEQEAISLLTLDNRQSVVNEIALSTPDCRRSKRRTGVTVVTAAPMISERAFVSGGYDDHTIHLWKVDESFSGGEASSLAIKHNSVVQSLLPLQSVTGLKLVSAGADCVINVFDLHSQLTEISTRISSPVYQVHETPFPFSLLFQVAHREAPFEIRDYRALTRQPVQRFGKITAITSRLIRGSVESNTFACGSREGIISLWDLRNTFRPVQELECAHGRAIVHTAVVSSNILAASQDFQMWYTPIAVS